MQERTSASGGHPRVTRPPAQRSPGLLTQPRGDLFDPTCNTRRLLDRIGSKWVAMIIKTLNEHGELRYAELKRRTPGISAKMLAQTLRGLERDRLVARRVEATVPPSVHYRLTTLGESLNEPPAALRDWAELHMAEVDGIA